MFKKFNILTVVMLLALVLVVAGCGAQEVPAAEEPVAESTPIPVTESVSVSANETPESAPNADNPQVVAEDSEIPPGHIRCSLERILDEEGAFYKLTVSSVMWMDVDLFIEGEEVNLFRRHFGENETTFFYPFEEGRGFFHLIMDDFHFQELEPNSSVFFDLTEDVIPVAFINAYGWHPEGEEEMGTAWQVVSREKHDLILIVTDVDGKRHQLIPRIDEVDRGVRNQVFYLGNDFPEIFEEVMVVIDRGKWDTYLTYLSKPLPEQLTDEEYSSLDRDQILEKVQRVIYLAHFSPADLEGTCPSGYYTCERESECCPIGAPTTN